MAKYSLSNIKKYKSIDVGARTRTKARRDVGNNTTKELSVGDFVGVKLSQLYSQVCKMVKDHDKKYIVIKYSSEIYIIHKVLKEDNEGLENKRYTL